MYTTRIGLAILTLVMIIPILVSPSATAARQQAPKPFVAKNVEAKVLMDSKGAIHILWTVPLLNHSGSAPGLWYSMHAPNGSDSIPPTLIRNSSLVQSADMALDKFDRPHVVWAEGPAFMENSSDEETMQSGLYYGEINSTNTQLIPTALTGPGRLIAWPSMAIDDNLTAHLVWTQLDRNNGLTAGAYYASMAFNTGINQSILIATFNQTLISIPRPRIAFNQAADDLHVAWVESDGLAGGQVVSSVSYAKVDLKWKNVTRLVLAKFNEPVEGASVTAGSAGNAYVVWQQEDTSRTPTLVYVARISQRGQILFLKELVPPSARNSTFGVVVSADSQDNLHVVWYQPGTPPQHTLPASQTLANVAYLKLDSDGSLAQSGSEFVNGPVIAVTVSGSGDVYAISQQGMVRVGEPASINVGLIGVAVAGASALGGAVATEELRYRMFRSMAPISRTLKGRRNDEPANGVILRTLSRKPGLTVRDLRSLLPDEKATLLKLTMLEANGQVSSVRTGFGRKFYSSGLLMSPGNSASLTYESIQSRVLHEIERNPGTWEAKLAKTLGLSQQIVHYHLRKLQNAKMITAESIGRRRQYRLQSAQRPSHDDLS